MTCVMHVSCCTHIMSTHTDVAGRRRQTGSTKEKGGMRDGPLGY